MSLYEQSEKSYEEFIGLISKVKETKAKLTDAANSLTKATDIYNENSKEFYNLVNSSKDFREEISNKVESTQKKVDLRLNNHHKSIVDCITDLDRTVKHSLVDTNEKINAINKSLIDLDRHVGDSLKGQSEIIDNFITVKLEAHRKASSKQNSAVIFFLLINFALLLTSVFGVNFKEIIM